MLTIARWVACALFLAPMAQADGVDTVFGGTLIVRDPSQAGPFGSCVTDITQTVDVGGVELVQFAARAFFPQAPDAGANCVLTGPERPLVLIYHALGAGPEDYEVLGRRLASHGMVVASLEFSDDLTEAITALDEEIGAFLSDDVALIGHSRGGDLMVERRRQPIPLGKRVAAMVLMAPRVSEQPLVPQYELTGVESFLGLHWTGDNDSATWGKPSLNAGGVRTSVFRIYDRAGVDFDAPDQLGLTKHFVFFDLGLHFTQADPEITAYTTAFLRRYLLGDFLQDRFLKGITPPEGLDPANHPVLQQHEEPTRIMFANFEESGPAPTPFNGLRTEGVTAFPPAIFAFSDPFSPHDLGVLRFHFNALTEDEHRLAIRLFEPGVEATGMTHLSFRMAQEYRPERAQSGEALIFDVCVFSGGERCVTRTLPFPIVNEIVVAQTGERVDATKNAMRTYRVRLSQLGVSSGDLVQGVSFDFSQSGQLVGERHDLAVDQVQLTR